MINYEQIIRDIQYYFYPSPNFLSKDYKHSEECLVNEWSYYFEFLKGFKNQNEYLAAAKIRTIIMQFVADNDLLNKSKEIDLEVLINLQNMVYNYNYLHELYGWDKYELRQITPEEIEPPTEPVIPTVFNEPVDTIFNSSADTEDITHPVSFDLNTSEHHGEIYVGAGYEFNIENNPPSTIVLDDDSEIYDQIEEIFSGEYPMSDEDYFPDTDDIPTEPQYPDYHELPFRENLKISVLDMINTYYIAKKSYYDIGSPILYAEATIDNIFNQINSLDDKEVFILELQSMCEFPPSLLQSKQQLIDIQEIIKAKQKLAELTKQVDTIKQDRQIVTNLKEHNEAWLTPNDLQAIISISRI